MGLSDSVKMAHSWICVRQIPVPVFFYEGILTDLSSLWALQMKNQMKGYQEIKRRLEDRLVNASQKVC